LRSGPAATTVPGMQLIRYRPAAPLDRFVEWLWWSSRDRPQDHAEYMLPSGRAQLIFLLHDHTLACGPTGTANPLAWSRSVLHGPQSSYFCAAAKPAGAAVGVSFRPGAAGAILGAPLGEFTDRHVALDSVWGSRAGQLRQRLMEAAEPAQIFRIIEDDLISRLRRPLQLHPAVAQALASSVPCDSLPAPVRLLQRASGYSPRHFIALFRAAVGLSPKHYFRIQRLSAAAATLAAARGRSLSEIAATHGYADQSHLTRDFRELAGVTPKRFAPAGPDRPLHHSLARGDRSSGR
jgi:AraC-like DNA-binding protein